MNVFIVNSPSYNFDFENLVFSDSDRFENYLTRNDYEFTVTDTGIYEIKGVYEFHTVFLYETELI